MQQWMSRTLIGGALVIGAFGAVTGQESTGETPPTLRVESERMDIGEVVAGRAGAATFVFHNDTDVEVRILRAAPS